jgi:hypothetical protein
MDSSRLAQTAAKSVPIRPFEFQSFFPLSCSVPPLPGPRTSSVRSLARMVSLRSAAVALVMILPVCVSAQQTNQVAPNGIAPHYESIGVTANGERVTGRQSRDNQAPWQKDLVKSPGPKYPYQARAHHWQGAACFESTLIWRVDRRDK